MSSDRPDEIDPFGETIALSEGERNSRERKPFVKESDVDAEVTFDTVSTRGADPDASTPFVIGSEIARGGIGAVLEAHDCKLGRSIAVKVLLDNDADEETKSRFVREGAILGKLQHPNIVPVYDLGRDESEQVYYTMKLVRGRTLQEIIVELREQNEATVNHYTVDRLLMIFRKICDAVAFAHSKGIIHRDLKPENVMVGEFGEVLVMDWGLSKVLGESESTETPAKFDREMMGSFSVDATLEGAVMGTPQYMSPEQAGGDSSRVDFRSDIYSLGGILYAILALRPPVEGGTVWEMIENVREGKSNPISTSGSSTKADAPSSEIPHISTGKVPEALSAVATKALALDPRDRYRDVSALGDDIEKWQNGFATLAEHAGLLRQLTLLVRRHRTVFGTVAAALVVLASFSVWFVTNLQASERRAVKGEAAAREASAKSAILLAEAAYEKGDGKLVRDFLDQVPEENRDPNWDYLNDQSDTTVFRASGSLRDVKAHPIRPGCFVVSHRDGSIAILDVRSGQELLRLKHHQTSPVVAISSDGRRIAVGSDADEGDTISVYDAGNGTLLKNWASRISRDLEFHPDGELWLQSTRGESSSRGVCLWKTTLGELEWEIPPSKATGQMTSRFFFDGSQVVTASRAWSGFRLHSLADGKQMETFGDHRTDTFYCMNDGSTMVSLTREGLLTAYDYDREESLFSLPQPANLNFVGCRLVSGTNRNSFHCIQRHKDGRVLVEERSRIDGSVLRSRVNQARGVWAAALHPVTSDLFLAGNISACWEGPPRPYWSVESSEGRLQSGFWLDDFFIVQMGRGGRWLVDLKQSEKPPARKSRVRKLGNFRPLANSNLALFSSELGAQQQRPYRVATLTEEGVTEIASFYVKDSLTSASLSPDGTKFAGILQSSAAGRPIEWFEVESGTPRGLLSIISDQIGRVRQFGWLSNSSQIIGVGFSGDLNGDAALLTHGIAKWDVGTGEIIASTSHPDELFAMSIAPDGKQFAEGGRDRILRIRDTETLEILNQFRVHDGTIIQVAWHPTRPILATASDDYTVRIWDSTNGKQLADLSDFTSAPGVIQFNRAGRYFAVVERNYTHIWKIRPESLSDGDNPPEGLRESFFLPGEEMGFEE